MESAPSGPTIRVHELTKRFGPVVALDAISVDIDAMATGLLGANGAGKSTLIRAVLGLLDADGGRIEVLGLDTAHHASEVRRMVGYMPEHDCLPQEMTARDFVVHLAELRGLPRRAAAVRASEVLFQVGLEEERSRPMGTFSLGMKQRTKLAQTLVHSPSLILLDEPTSGLDPAGRNDMLSLIRRLSSELGIRILMSSHVLDDVQRTCDEIIILAGGRLAGQESVGHRTRSTSGRLRVRVSGPADAFVTALETRGVRVEHDPESTGTLVVAGPADALSTYIRDAACESGVGIREIRGTDQTLEEVVVQAMA
jgi:ABC-2 type transport system ATP-binding protein